MIYFAGALNATPLIRDRWCINDGPNRLVLATRIMHFLMHFATESVSLGLHRQDIKLVTFYSVHSVSLELD